MDNNENISKTYVDIIEWREEGGELTKIHHLIFNTLLDFHWIPSHSLSNAKIKMNDQLRSLKLAFQVINFNYKYFVSSDGITLSNYESFSLINIITLLKIFIFVSHCLIESSRCCFRSKEACAN